MGGGSGGHVTPVVAVLNELKQDGGQPELRFWCDRKFAPQAKRIMAKYDDTIPVSIITAGKLRRYYHLTLWQHLLIPSVVFPNIIDICKVLIGFVQAVCKLILWRPDAIFLKGGFVCLPVGWAARLLNVPYVVHDSDAHPGLTNRLLAPHAKFIATGAPLVYYPYDKSKSYYVGIPISGEFHPLDNAKRRAIKCEYGFDETQPLIVVTGGGLGAKRINDAIVKLKPRLTARASVLLITGVGQYDIIRQQVSDDANFKLTAFVSSGMAQLLGAADIVVARAGATSILELAAVGAPSILVPNGRLTGGHQLKNAKVYEDAGAVLIADEEKFKDDENLLYAKIDQLLSDDNLRQDLHKKIRKFAKPNAASETAKLIKKAAQKST